MHKQKYYIQGMHCVSCEINIEKKILEIDGVEFVDASLSDGNVLIGYKKEKPHSETLNRIFKENGYKFSETPNAESYTTENKLLSPALIALAIVIIFWMLEKTGLTSYIKIGQASSLMTFFGLGLIAGVSSCAALVGGLILSLSKQWSEKYSNQNSLSEKIEPHILFNSGRISSYVFFGAILGFIGQKIQLSLTITSILVLFVSFVMTILALQMIGIKYFSKIKITLPKDLSLKIANKKISGRLSPFIIGSLTFFLPCGFTLVAQGAAILSGNPVSASAIMLAFALGTFIPLIFIGLLSTKLIHGNSSDKFLKVSGFLILFFVIYNLNTQFNFSALWPGQTNSTPLTNIEKQENVQIIQATYTNNGDIQPNNFTVKQGQPVRFEVLVKETGYGCMSTIMIIDLYNKPQRLIAGSKIIMEFIPTKTGDYTIACAMGVPRGTIKVIP